MDYINDNDDDEWMEIYATFSEFELDDDIYTYYQCWGGGPTGGIIVNKRHIYKINRNWGEEWTKEPIDGKIHIEIRDNILQLRIIPK